MEWQEPKTDWKIQPAVNGMYAGDWFNASDYNRIAGNLEYLAALGATVYKPVSIDPMPTITYQDYGLPSYFNLIEDNLLSIAEGTYSPPSYEGKKTWAANGPAPTVEDLNRWERTILLIYENYQMRMAGWVKLPVPMPQNFGGSEW